jgi:carbon monoxide dehydrogenase subunit G
MSERSIEVIANIRNTPEAVISYIADVRHRTDYLTSLKSVTDVREAPGQMGTTWRWTWSALGLEFEGTGTCVAYEPGKLYSFRTEGGIASTWTYTAAPEGGGTKLTIRAEFEVPERARSVLPAGEAAEAMKKAGAERVVQNLKHILDR